MHPLLRQYFSIEEMGLTIKAIVYLTILFGMYYMYFIYFKSTFACQTINATRMHM
jgi:hypothetical protein